MVHGSVLRKHFFVNEAPEKWVSLEAPDRRRVPGYQTNRFAKVYDGERLYFTIGETRRGKRNSLSQTIAGIVSGYGLAVIRIPSTSGRPSVFVGFYLTECSPEVLEHIIRKVRREVALCG